MARPFASTPYAGPGYEEGPSRITDLILRAGDARARAAEQQGQIWGSTVAGLGQMAGGMIQDYQAQKAARAKQAQIGRLLTAAQDPNIDFRQVINGMPEHFRPEALKIFGEFENAEAQRAQRLAQADKYKAELEKLTRENAESEQYDYAKGASILLNALGTEAEDSARVGVLGYFGRKNPDVITKIQQMPDEELKPLLQQFVAGSPKFQEEIAKLEQTRAETQAKLAEPGFRAQQLAGQEAERAALAQYRQQQLAQGAAGLSETRRHHLATEAAVTPGAGSDEASFLLQGGTADKLPIKTRAAAVEAARASGGVDGTGFVPNSAQQQAKFSDFMDLRAKALRLKELLTDKEVQAKLGPGMGSWTGKTREFLGASTKVKEAFDLFGDLSDTELRKRTGAQASKPEYDRILGFTVAATKEADSNNTNLDRMLTIMNSGLSRIGATNLPATSGLGQPGYVSTDPNAGKPVK